MVKTHIMRWAGQDYRTCRARIRSIATADPWLRLVYLEALNALHEAGGELAADPDSLSDVLGCPPAEIERCLPILEQIARVPGGRDGLDIEDGAVKARFEFVRRPVRGHICLATREFVSERDGGLCVFCGAQEQLEYDHVRRYRDGGSDKPENLRLLCGPCNRRRH